MKPALFKVCADEYAAVPDPYLKPAIPYVLSVGRSALTFVPKSCFACAKTHTVMLSAVIDCKKIVNAPQKLSLGIQAESHMHKLWVEGGDEDETVACFSKIQSMRHFLVNGEVLVAGWINPLTKAINYYEKNTALRLFAMEQKLRSAVAGTKKEEAIVGVEGQTMVKMVKKKYGVMLTTEVAVEEGEPLICSVFVEAVDSSVLTLSIFEDKAEGVPQFKLPDRDFQKEDVVTMPLTIELTPEKILDSPPVSGMTVPKAQRPRTISGTGGRASVFGGSNPKPPKEPKPEGEPTESKGGIMGKIKRGTSIATKKDAAAAPPAAEEATPTAETKA